MNHILLVEGNNDKAVFGSIFQRYNLQENFQIEVKDNIENLIKSIPVHVKTDVETIGIVIDSDFNIKSRWESLKNKLKLLEYDVPSDLNPNGTIISSEELPVIGVWIMPDNKSKGMLEDFVSYLVPADDKLMPVVDETLIKLEERGLNKYKDIHKSKAKIHTWLSWQETPGTPMGLAITKGYFDTNKEMCDKFVKWIVSLYHLSLDK